MIVQWTQSLIIGSVKSQVVEKEALALKKEFGTPRRTLVEQDRDGEINDIDVIANDETIVVSKHPYLSMDPHPWVHSQFELIITQSQNDQWRHCMETICSLGRHWARRGT